MDLMHNWHRISERLADLYEDIYPQPPDPGHTAWGLGAINELMVYAPDANRVLDVGCGQGVFAGAFSTLGKHWAGVTLGRDFQACQERSLLVWEADMSDLPFPDEHYDLIFARHVLEHSPFPILTLMEWRRVSKKYLLLVSPTPEHWGVAGRNHYSVAPEAQLEWWLKRAGWAIEVRRYLNTSQDEFLIPWRQSFLDTGAGVPGATPDYGHRNVEYRFLCKKTEPRTE